MANGMWPMILDYDRDECRQMLRRLELEAYSSVVSALRAQGEFNKEKKQILQQLCHLFSITIERHQAEIRRAVNDEKLNTIAFTVSNENTYSEWAAEGRRLVPLMPRLVPQTAITSIANVAASLQAAKNEAIIQSAAMKAVQDSSKDLFPCKRKRTESNGNIEFQKPTKAVSTNSSLSVSNFCKSAKTVSTVKASTSSSQSSPVSSSPRVVLMASSASGLRTLTSSSSSSATIGSVENLQIKTPLKPSSITVSGLTSTTANQSSSVSGTRVFSAKATFPQQVVVFPGSNSSQKTITIPFAQPVKLPQGSSSSATLVYQQGSSSPATIKGIPGTFTIQTFKPSQSNKLQTPNLIIMPSSKSSLCQVSKPVATIVGSNAKGLTRQLSAKEVKIVSGETGKDERSTNQLTVRPTNNVIEIQATGAVFQNIMKTGQLQKDLMDLVQKAVNNGTQGESLDKTATKIDVGERGTVEGDNCNVEEAKQ